MQDLCAQAVVESMAESNPEALARILSSDKCRATRMLLIDSDKDLKDFVDHAVGGAIERQGFVFGALSALCGVVKGPHTPDSTEEEDFESLCDMERALQRSIEVSKRSAGFAMFPKLGSAVVRDDTDERQFEHRFCANGEADEGEQEVLVLWANAKRSVALRQRVGEGV